jgi:hypothetical protein
MTVVPPSVHVTGESIEWATCDTLGVTTRAELVDALSSMAICASVVPHHVEGNRNEVVLALGGTLLRAGKSEQAVLRLVSALCDHTGDEEKQARLETVRNTAIRVRAGKPVTQFRRLRELLGEAAADALRSYLGENLDSLDTGRWRAAILDVEDRNDSGLGKLFAAWVGDRVRFATDARAFYVCGPDAIWTQDNDELEVGLRFDNFIVDRLEDLENVTGISDEERQRERKFLLKYRDRPNARNAIKQSASLVSIHTNEFDCGDDIIAVRNGLLNLREGVLTPCRPEHYVTRRLNIIYDQYADCPTFSRVLADAFKGDEALIAYFIGLMGYWLTGSRIVKNVTLFTAKAQTARAR